MLTDWLAGLATNAGGAVAAVPAGVVHVPVLVMNVEVTPGEVEVGDAEHGVPATAVEKS